MKHMRSLWTAIVIVLLIPLGEARDRDEFDLEFTAPVQLAGALDFKNLQWAILVFPVEGNVLLHAELNGIYKVMNHSSLAISRPDYLVLGNATSTQPLLDQDLQHEADFSGKLGFGKGLGSLVIHAESIALRLETRTQLAPSLANSSMDSYIDRVGFAEDAARWGAYPSPSHHVVSTLAEMSDQPIQIHATGVKLLEWFNAEVQCAAGCLPRGGSYRMASVYPLTTDVLSYISVRSASGELQGVGPALAAAVGGETITVAAEGYMRMPEANVTGRCGLRTCPDPEGETFRANGTLLLSDVRILDPGTSRMKARFVGNIEAASFGETTIFGFSTRTAAWTAFGLLAALGLVKALAALFTRHHWSALDHPRCREVFDLVVAQPGLSFSELKRRTGIGNGNLVRHLTKLEAERFVVPRAYRNSKRYYENHSRYDAHWQQHAALMDERCRLVHDWLTVRPGSTQTQILTSVARGLSRSTLQHAIEVLSGAGLIRQEKQGRFVHYWAIPFSPAGQQHSR